MILDPINGVVRLGYCRHCQAGYSRTYRAWCNEETVDPVTGEPFDDEVAWEDQADTPLEKLPEFRDACGHHHLYHHGCALDLRGQPEPGPIWVTLYLVDRAYGGPEEGGWWYNTGRVVAAWPVATREAAEGVCELAEAAGYTNEGRRDIGSVLSEGAYRYHFDWEPGRDFPDHRPHYE